MRYNDIRRKTRSITVGNCRIGARSPIAIQSMTNTSTIDAISTLHQVRALERAGCDVVRLAVPSEEAAYTERRSPPIKLTVIRTREMRYGISI